MLYIYFRYICVYIYATTTNEKQEATNLKEHQGRVYGNPQRRKGRGKWCKHIIISKFKIVCFKNHKKYPRTNDQYKPTATKTVWHNHQYTKQSRPGGPWDGPFHSQAASLVHRQMVVGQAEDPSAGRLRVQRFIPDELSQVSILTQMYPNANSPYSFIILSCSLPCQIGLIYLIEI